MLNSVPVAPLMINVLPLGSVTAHSSSSTEEDVQTQRDLEHRAAAIAPLVKTSTSFLQVFCTRYIGFVDGVRRLSRGFQSIIHSQNGMWCPR